MKILPSREIPTLTADDNIAIGNNSVITGNTAADGVISAGGQISIGDGTQVLDNTATSDGKAAINLADGQTLYIGSGAILSGNTSNGVSGSVQAGQNTRINVYTDATAYTFINDGISTAVASSTADAAPLAADQTVMTKTGAELSFTAAQEPPIRSEEPTSSLKAT